MPISTRLARLDDCDQVVVLWRRFMAEEAEAVPDANPNAAEASWTARLRGQIAAGKALVVTQAEALVGFLAFIDHDDRLWVPRGVAYVVDVYVMPEARATVAGRALYDTAAVLLSARYAETWTNTHVRNRRMQTLLKRAGFAPLTGFAIAGLADQVYLRRSSRAGVARVADSE